MIILGIHFGHDASIAVLNDGIPVFVYEKERYNRVKHAIGIDAEDIRFVLAQCGLTADSIDFCALTTTQAIEYAFFTPDDFSFSVEANGVSELDSPFFAQAAHTPDREVETTLRANSRQFVQTGSPQWDHYWQYFKQYRDRDMEAVPVLPPMENLIHQERWESVRTLDQMACEDYSDLIASQDFRRSFHVPAKVCIFGRSIPGIVLSHHYAHAAYAYFESDFKHAGIISHDGAYDGNGYRAGMFYYGSGSAIYPLTPHFLCLGSLYDTMSKFLGLGIGGAGKTMGLAAYGRPMLLAREFIGNIYDDPTPRARTLQNFPNFCVQIARSMNYDLTPLSDPSRILEKINIDLAATLQAACEQTMRKAANALHELLEKSSAATDNLCLSGGTALNCPSNTDLYLNSKFSDVFVPPACGDTGLSLGSAYMLYHSLLGEPRAGLPRTPASRKYLGAFYTAADLDSALSHYDGAVLSERCVDAAADAAAMLAEDAIIGWFEGRSEIGPRALGHRSILANPQQSANWGRVNRIKGREFWRPFAPMVLLSESAKWFKDAPVESPYMLFNAKVKTDKLPAITHVDQTSRIQTVTPEDGTVHDVLAHFSELTGVPVLLNTSFNGPGEPIVESPADALRFFVKSELDAVFIDGWKVTKAGTAAAASARTA